MAPKRDAHCRNEQPPGLFGYDGNNQVKPMRGILLWVLGIPIPIIILLYIFHVI